MNVLYQGTRNLQDTKTGEIIEVDFLLKDIEVDFLLKDIKKSRSDFEITYLNNLFNLFDALGGKRYALIKYIIENRNCQNQLFVTVEELAQLTKISRPKVIETLTLLKKYNLIERRTGAIMLNPKLINRGSVCNERYLLQKFTSF